MESGQFVVRIQMRDGGQTERERERREERKERKKRGREKVERVIKKKRERKRESRRDGCAVVIITNNSGRCCRCHYDRKCAQRRGEGRTKDRWKKVQLPNASAAGSNQQQVAGENEREEKEKRGGKRPTDWGERERERDN